MEFFEQLTKLCTSNPTLSDIYMQPGLEVSYSLDGKLTASGVTFPEEAVQPFLQLANLSEWKVDTNHALKIGDFRFRANLLEVDGGHKKTVMRLIRNEIPTMDQSRIPKQVRDVFLQKSAGLLLVSGPMGSGKSTSLASGFSARAGVRDEHFLTLEQPIEYRYKSRIPMQFSQREVNLNTASYVTGLVSGLRQDARNILLGEVKEPETACAAFDLALRGNFVATTIHATRASAVIESFLSLMKDAGRYNQGLALFPSIFLGAVCMRLVPKDAGGRFPIYEVLMPSPAVSSFTKKGEFDAIGSEVRNGGAAGHLHFRQSLIQAQNEKMLCTNSRTAIERNLGIENEL